MQKIGVIHTAMSQRCWRCGGPLSEGHPVCYTCCHSDQVDEKTTNYNGYCWYCSASKQPGAYCYGCQRERCDAK